MGNSLQDNVLVFIENPDPASAIWQARLASGILDHANNRVNEFGLPYHELINFVRESLTVANDLVFKIEPKSRIADEFDTLAKATIRKFFEVSDRQTELASFDETFSPDDDNPRTILGKHQVKEDAWIVEAVADRVSKRVLSDPAQAISVEGSVQPSTAANTPPGLDR